VQILQHSDQREDLLIDAAAQCIRAGGTLVFPTETVYGLGAAAEDDGAIEAIYRAKGRAFNKPLALHVAVVAQAQPFVARWPHAALRAIDHFWPGALALIVPRVPGRFEKASAGFATISVRCPSHALTQKILARTGALAATSANRSGAPAFDGSAARSADLPPASLAIVAGPTALQRESTIMDCTLDPPAVLRWGAIDRRSLEAVMGTLA